MKRLTRILTITAAVGMMLQQATAGELHWIGVGHGWPKNWNKAANWSLTQGGAGGAGVPTSADDVYIDGGGGLIQINNNAVCRSFSQSLAGDSTYFGSGGSLTIGQGGLILSGGVLDGTNSSLISDSGSWAINGGTFNAGMGSVVLAGTSSHTVSGPATFFNLTINNAAGLNVSGPLTVNGILMLMAGEISTGTDTVTLAAGAAVVRTAGSVNGYLRKYAPVGADTMSFELGDSLNYTPVSLTFGYVRTAGRVTASALRGDHPMLDASRIDPMRSVNRHWSIGSDIAFDRCLAFLTFAPSDLDSQAVTTGFIVQEYDSAGWSMPLANSVTPSGILLPGLTAFGDFAAGMIDTPVIGVTAGVHGMITPSGTVRVLRGESSLFAITPDSGYAVYDVRVDGSSIGAVTSYSFSNVVSDHTILALFAPLDTLWLSVQNQWNLVSVPLSVPDFDRTVLFPMSIGTSFQYQGGMYQAASTLAHGRGYWVKFPGAQTITLNGGLRTTDTIVVSMGWNLIGSIGMPVAISAITSNSSGMTTSAFFGYAGGYFRTDTIRPGKAYWVKVNQAGSLILSAAGSASPKNRINIVREAENPPAPPEVVGQEHPADAPQTYTLQQNYPNPFNPTTVIHFTMPQDGRVTLKVFTLLGQEIATLVDGWTSAGEHAVTFDASARGGLPTGIYIYTLTTGSFTQARKMVLAK